MNLYEDSDGNRVFRLYGAHPAEQPQDYERAMVIFTEVTVDKQCGHWEAATQPGGVALYLSYGEFRAKYQPVPLTCSVDIYAILHQSLDKATAHRYAIEIEAALTLAAEEEQHP